MSRNMWTRILLIRHRTRPFKIDLAFGSPKRRNKAIAPYKNCRAVRSSILPGERPRDLAGAIDEELRRGADHALLQSDKADATGRNPNIDLEGPQSKAL